MPHKLKYRVLAEKLSVCQLAADAPIPTWALSGEFFCVVRVAEEVSVVCDESRVPGGVRAEKGWVALKLNGPFPFSMTGVLASFIQPLAEAKIPIFAVSTFDTDYVLIKRESLETALRTLEAAGHERA